MGDKFLRCDLISGGGGLFRRGFLCLSVANTLQCPGRSDMRIEFLSVVLINTRRRFIWGRSWLILSR